MQEGKDWLGRIVVHLQKDLQRFQRGFHFTLHGTPDQRAAFEAHRTILKCFQGIKDELLRALQHGKPLR
jgi:hypothetical protein